MFLEFQKLAQRVADLERRQKGQMRQGTVASVDAASRTVRLKLGENENGPYLSAPIPYVQTGGALKIHNPPSVGQQMAAMSPDGDLRNAVAMPLGFSDANPSPSGAGDQHVMTFGSVTVRLSSDGFSITVGGVSALIDGSGLHVTGGGVDHNGTDIGDTHTHSGITPGPARTSDPK
jgi:hypothetical protein